MSPHHPSHDQGALTLEEAVARVRAHPEERAAWEVVRCWLRKLVRRITSEERYAEGAVDSVLEKLLDQALSRDLPEIESPKAYLGTALRWRVCSLARKEKAEERALERQRAKLERQRHEEPPPISDDALGLLERAHELAVKRRDAWQREHLLLAWAQVKELILEDRSLREIVTRDEGLDPDDAEAIKRAVARAHKAHQRARAAVDEALAILIRRDQVDDDAAAAAREALTRLRRRRAVRSQSPDASPRRGTRR